MRLPALLHSNRLVCPSWALRVACAVLIGGVLTGCISSSPTSQPSTADDASFGAVDERASWQTEDVERDLRTAAQSWDGVPHEWGGTSRRGVDCSGLVQNVYADALAVSLPRTTDALAQTGSQVRRNGLQPGDLVFFKTGRKTRHVGVYLSGGEFVHASSSRGVMVSRLQEPYWSQRWWQARRVLPPMTAAKDAAPRDASGSRAGW